jgi:hypothetical protein
VLSEDAGEGRAGELRTAVMSQGLF